MPPKKVAWGDIPNKVFIDNKDNDKGKWIKCKICHVVIRVRASFGFTEWENHCSLLRHCQKVKDQLLIGNSSKLTSYFISDNSNKKDENVTNVKLSSNKRIKLVTSCPGFSFGKTQNCFNSTTSTGRMILSTNLSSFTVETAFGVLIHVNARMKQ